MSKILRTWTFWIRTDLRDECNEYLDRHILVELRKQPGNHRAVALFNNLPDSTTQVVVASVWDSMEHIRAYDGAGTKRPKIDPSVRAKILDRDAMLRYYVIDSVDDPALAVLTAGALNAVPKDSDGDVEDPGAR